MVGIVLSGLIGWTWCQHPFAECPIVDVDVTVKWTATPFVDSPPLRDGINNRLPIMKSSYVHDGSGGGVRFQQKE